MMELLQNLVAGFEYNLSWIPLLTIVGGVSFGILVGAMPGLSPSMGVALLVPFTYSMSPTLAVVLLAAVYLAADYGGSITAVTINAPGTPAATVTAFDGYELTKQGKPGIGLGVSLIASTVGGVIGTLILIFFSAPLAKLALSFHAPEYFAIAVFGLTSIASVGGKDWTRVLLMAFFGLLINTIGIDPISGSNRFTFGIPQLYDGFSLVPALIGLFALSEVFIQIHQGHLESINIRGKTSAWPTFREYLALSPTIFGSSIVGTVIGVFPGAGATIASFVSYDLTKRFSSKPESFGHGNPAGVAAAEAANSASVGGALVPLLTLGIPGSATTAVLIGALMIHDVVPGPELFKSNPSLIYRLFASLLIANVVLLILGLFGSRIWIRVCSVPKPVLYPMILSIAVVGSFAVRYSMFDVISCVGFGFLGWYLRLNAYPVVPIILGMVLGTIIETNFRQSVLMGGYSIFFARPICMTILSISFIALAVPILFQNKSNPRKPE